MKTPVQDLTSEHDAVRVMLQILAKVADKLRSGENVKVEHLQKILEFLQNFVDKCHHGKEENILFPALIADDKFNATIISELLGEHKTGRDLIRGFAESLSDYKQSNEHAYHIAVNFESYIRLLTEHINKENTLILPLADKLPAEQQTTIEEKFEDAETNIIGSDKHVEYHHWLIELQNLYLL